MKMLLTLSWRNIWRHPARSGILLGAIISGLWAGIIISAWTNGLMDQRFEKLIHEELTHLQIHHPDFLTEREPDMSINQADQITGYLEGDNRIDSFTVRIRVDGMVQSARTTSGVEILGIDPELERQATTFHENLVAGSYLDSDLRNPIVVSRDLADKLNASIGQRIVLTFQNLNQNLTSGSFHISGLYHTGNPGYDDRLVIVRGTDLNTLLEGGDVIHEIAIMLHNLEESAAVAGDMNEQFNSIRAETWHELSPELRYLTGTGSSLLFYIMVVIMLALAFGILNTMLMSIFERTRELGMLKAVGMARSRLFLMIMLESVMLTMSGAAGGMLLARATVSWLSENGLDLTRFGGDTLAEWGYDAVVYPVIHPQDFLIISLLVIVTALLAAIYPAIKALRINPAEVVQAK